MISLSFLKIIQKLIKINHFYLNHAVEYKITNKTHNLQCFKQIYY